MSGHQETREVILPINTHSIDIIIGNQIRKRRKACGMTQTQLAEPLEAKYQQIQKLESAANRVSAAQLFILAMVLNVPLYYFFEPFLKEKIKLDHYGFASEAINLCLDFIENHQKSLDDLRQTLLRT